MVDRAAELQRSAAGRRPDHDRQIGTASLGILMAADQDADPRGVQEADLAEVKHHSLKPAAEQLQDRTFHLVRRHEVDLADHPHGYSLAVRRELDPKAMGTVDEHCLNKC